MSPGSNLPLAALQQIEAAALQLLAAVRQAGDARFVSNPPPHGSVTGPGMVTVAELFNSFLLSKARAGRSENYCGLLLKELRSFAEGREGRAVASITAHEVETWLHGQGWSAATQRGRLLTLRNVLSWAVTRGELAGNVALGVDMPQKDNLPPGIHTPEQVRAVLEYAAGKDLNALRCLAVRYFAGLRTSEAVALAESEIGERYIEVTAEKAKTRRRRLVTIQPALRAWLDLGGRLPLGDSNTRLNRITHGAGVEWPRNVARHSFCTYHLAHFGNAGKTALEAGHSEQMLFAHYREVVSPIEASRFWEIKP